MPLLISNNPQQCLNLSPAVIITVISVLYNRDNYFFNLKRFLVGDKIVNFNGTDLVKQLDELKYKTYRFSPLQFIIFLFPVHEGKISLG